MLFEQGSIGTKAEFIKAYQEQSLGKFITDVTQNLNFAIHSGWLKPNRYESQNIAGFSHRNYS